MFSEALDARGLREVGGSHLQAAGVAVVKGRCLFPVCLQRFANPHAHCRGEMIGRLPLTSQKKALARISIA